MDQPDAVETNCPSAPILVCRRTRRLQTTTIDNLVHGRIARSLTLTNHRVSANAASTTTSTLNVRLRPVRTGKREPRRTDRTLHTIHILHSSRTLGRILRKHARASLRLFLPDPPPTILKEALRNKIRCDVRPLSRALPNTSLDLGPHSHRGASLRILALERDTPADSPKVNRRNRHRWRRAGRPEEHPLRHPDRRAGPSNQAAYQRKPIHVLVEPSRRATLHPQWTVRELDYHRSRIVRLFRTPVQRPVRTTSPPLGRSS